MPWEGVPFCDYVKQMIPYSETNITAERGKSSAKRREIRPIYLKKIKKCVFLDLIFPESGINYYLEFYSDTAEYDSKLFTSVISAKVYENRPSSSTSLLPMSKKYQQETIVSLYLAGRLSIVSWAGSWPDLHTHVWGSVRLFLSLGVASCVIYYPVRGQNVCSSHQSSSVIFSR